MIAEERELRDQVIELWNNRLSIPDIETRLNVVIELNEDIGYIKTNEAILNDRYKIKQILLG